MWYLFNLAEDHLLLYYHSNQKTFENLKLGFLQEFYRKILHVSEIAQKSKLSF